MNRVKQILFTAAIALWLADASFLSAPIFSDEPPADVGIDEKTGSPIPLDLKFNDEEGSFIELRSLMGKPTILTLVYFECPAICTPLLNNLMDTLGRVDLEPGRDYQILTISFDAKDTPALAARKRENYLKQFNRKVAPEAWRFLTGDQAAIDAITDAVGFRYKAVGRDFNHPGVVMVLSADGRIMRYLQGISFMPFDLKMSVLEASKGRTMTPLNRVLAFCYSYDPEGRRYAFNFLKVVGVTMFTFLVLFFGWLLLTTKKHRAQLS